MQLSIIMANQRWSPLGFDDQICGMRSDECGTQISLDEYLTNFRPLDPEIDHLNLSKTEEAYLLALESIAHKPEIKSERRLLLEQTPGVLGAERERLSSQNTRQNPMKFDEVLFGGRMPIFLHKKYFKMRPAVPMPTPMPITMNSESSASEHSSSRVDSESVEDDFEHETFHIRTVYGYMGTSDYGKYMNK